MIPRASGLAVRGREETYLAANDKIECVVVILGFWGGAVRKNKTARVIVFSLNNNDPTILFFPLSFINQLWIIQQSDHL